MSAVTRTRYSLGVLLEGRVELTVARRIAYEVFEELGERANGTTNIDYSDKLYGEFQKIRSYKTTTLDIDPSGFDVKTTAEDTYREVKIDLPDTWVRGFLQVSAAATLPAHVVDLHPMDVHNLCLILRRNKELFGPRSLRFKLVPGMPVSITVDPWDITLACPRSVFAEGQPAEIRIWGRRRLFILERLLPRGHARCACSCSARGCRATGSSTSG